MENIKIEIFHKDIEYARAIARSISENQRGYSAAVIEYDRVHSDEKADTDSGALPDGKVIIYRSMKRESKEIQIYGI